MAQEAIACTDIADHVQRTADANASLMRGDICGYLALISHAGDYTLMAPLGGAPARAFDGSSEHLAARERLT